MRCKEGDLAIRVSASHKEVAIPVGAIVEVLSFVGRTPLFDIKNNRIDQYQNVWLVKYNGSARHTNGRPYGVDDSQLTPIRPSEGQDETLSWKDVPQGEYA